MMRTQAHAARNGGRKRRYLPISAYGLIGDCHTAALVGPHGNIDWWCPDRFDGPSVFARLLDHEKGGTFTIEPDAAYQTRFAYEGHTNILSTTFETENGRATLIDFMPLGADGALVGGRSRITRILKSEHGSVGFRLRFAPRPHHARALPAISIRAGAAMADDDNVRILLGAPDLPLQATQGEVVARFRLAVGESRVFCVQTDHDGEAEPPTPAVGRQLIHGTRRFWEDYAARLRYEGPYRDRVLRSALVLKALMHRPTGALVAAPTTSLPEWIGGERNWDYRYAWLRDTAFAVTAFQQSGHEEEAARLAHWVGDRVRQGGADDLCVLYRVDGEVDLEEKTLDHLEGHRGSRPVRIGNSGWRQWQLDAFGEAVECLHLARILDLHEEEERWTSVRDMIDHIAERWREPDSGIWEIRNAPRHFVLSKVFAWVALDRGVRAIEDGGLDGPLERWRQARDAVCNDVLAHGYDKKQGAFTQAYGWKNMDAANLLISIFGLLPATDPRIVSTVDRVIAELEEDGFLYRYRDADDGVPGREATFLFCTFLLIEVLAQMGRLEEAKKRMEHVLARASPLGLFAEQYDPQRRKHLGNYPQALTHLGLINAAAAIARVEAQEGEPSLHRAFTDTA
jgi:GH15 family glucan-1,4-alpha-glucosidase